MKADLLFVTCICPWPIRGGEYIRSYNTILALSRNFRVAALAPKPALECEALARVEEWVDLGRLGTEAERLQHKIFPHPEVVRSLRDTWMRFKPQVVWFDCGHWGNYALALRRYRPRMIMGTHNFQSALRRQQVAGARDLGERAKLWLFFLAERLHEKALFRFFDKVVSVSDIDREKHARVAGAGKCEVVPNFLDETPYGTAAFAKREPALITITGNFLSFQNKFGAEWFIRDVWPLVRSEVSHARLELVGRGSESIVQKGWSDSAISAMGEVDAMAPHLGRASVVAVPIKHGSGTRYKIIEALACRVPVVTTAIGAEGLNLASGDSCLIADSTREFAESMISILRNRDLGTRLAQKGYRIFSKDYSFAANAERLRDIVLCAAGKA
jgi:polysaccharide biosynthesis protein PslH